MKMGEFRSRMQISRIYMNRQQAGRWMNESGMVGPMMRTAEALGAITSGSVMDMEFFGRDSLE